MDRQQQPNRLERRIADGFFYALLAAAVLLAGWLSARDERYWDWTRTGRNTLSAESAQVVATLDAPLRITVFLDPGHPLAKRIEPLLARYRNAGARLEVRFLDPHLFPDQARAAEISLLGQTQLEYRNRRESLAELSETALTAAIARLARQHRPWVLFLEGHGERAWNGEAGTDIGRLGQVLQQRGYRLRALDLTAEQQIPPEADLVVLSTPAIALFPGETRHLTDYLSSGGNLLWLMDPGDLNGLEALADALGITPLPGVLVDANVQRLNIDDPRIVMIEDYPDHALTRGLTSPSLFPGSLAFLPVAAPDWTVETPLQTLENSWNETSPIRGEISRSDGRSELPGPLPLALALTRTVSEGRTQRLLLIGDGDFLSNAHLGNGANRTLGLRMMQWLTAPEGSEVPAATAAADRMLQLSRSAVLVLGGGSLVVLPVLFLAIGFTIRRQRMRD